VKIPEPEIVEEKEEEEKVETKEKSEKEEKPRSRRLKKDEAFLIRREIEMT
jgi:hypothetical protein